METTKTITGNPVATSLKKESLLKKVVRNKIIPQRFFNYGRVTKLSKCIGIIGPRGSMKSLSGTGITIIDYLIPGYTVWSNMGIKWGMKLGDYYVAYKTNDLDKTELLKLNVGGGMLFIDEINLEFSEARRSMTNRNLSFNKLIQMLRKKSLNLIYTVQHEMWVDDRLRFQTDIFIRCQDVMLKPGGIYLPYEYGTYCDWTVYDMSGFLGAGSYYDTGKPTNQVRFYGRRWWNCYDTNQLQGEDEEKYGQMPKQTEAMMAENQPEIVEDRFTKQEYAISEAIPYVIENLLSQKIYEVENDTFLDLVAAQSDDIDITTDSARRLINSLMRNNRYAKYVYNKNNKYWLLMQNGVLPQVKRKKKKTSKVKA